MAWVQILDSDSNGATPQPFSDLQGESTTMTAISSNGQASTSYAASGAPFAGAWFVGDNGVIPSEAHTHTFSNPVHVLRVEISALDRGDYANLVWTDAGGTQQAINLNDWIANGQAVVTLGAGHSITPLPQNPALITVHGSNTVAGQQGGITTIDFFFPTPASQLILGKNSSTNAAMTPRDAYAYKLFYDDSLSLLCFAQGTEIATASGRIAVENLRAGDLVQTLDHGLQAIRWIGSVKLSASDLDEQEHMRPIRIAAGALAPNVPDRDLLVSPQHRILIRSKVAQRMFDSDEVLIAAKHLLELDGVSIATDLESVEYFHVLFDDHQIVISNGAETESLYTGDQALRAISVQARKEIFALFPELALRNEGFSVPAARMIASGRKGRQLVMRHMKNAR